MTASQAIEEFLCWVYEQIDELLSQCSTQTRSLTSTPVSSSVTPQQAERQHDNRQQISAVSAPAKVDVPRLSHSAASTSQHGRRSVDAYNDRREKSRGDMSDGKSKTMSRIKLFSANQSESHGEWGFIMQLQIYDFFMFNLGWVTPITCKDEFQVRLKNSFQT